MQKIPVRGVNLEHAKARIECALGGFAEGISDGRNAVGAYGYWHGVIGREGNCAGRHDVGPAALSLVNFPCAFPGPERAGFSPCVRELNAGHAPLGVNEFGNSRQRFDMRIAPDPQILRTDARFRQDRRRFGDHQGGAADSTAAQMHEMPVGSHSVFA
jgi:hypothetical protein